MKKALPVNIDELIHGRTVEWERLEFKKGWNPEDVMHSICAFANDINNLGGGYIIIGIESDKGEPVLPPCGLKIGQIDLCQRELLGLCHKIIPNHFPIAVPYVFQERNILVLWVPAGDFRPYTAPVSPGSKSERTMYVRRMSSTVKVKPSEESQLYHLAAKIPFDDRINHHAFPEDLDPRLIKSFLKDVRSELYASADEMEFRELCETMQIIRGPTEYVKPVNAGLLMFNAHPEKFFPKTQIDIVEYHDDVGDKFSEKTIAGPIHGQLTSALDYIRNNVIKEEVKKLPGQIKTSRYFNYPIEAVKEALSNAVYHKSYEMRNPIEVNIRLDRIEILSFPGPVPPIDNQMLKKGHVIARDYRNRRIGDFFKELHLTEGRGTGIPKIRRAMKDNGSPEPVFETNEAREYFLTILPIHPDAAKGIKGETKGETKGEIIRLLKQNPKITIPEIAEELGLSASGIEYNFRQLKKQGKIKREGSTKDGTWKVLP